MIRKTTINERTWLYCTTDQLEADQAGECDYSDVAGLLTIDERQTGKELLDTIIHEWLHALLPHAKEEWVTTEANNLTALLTDKHILTRIGLFNKVKVKS